MWRTRIHDAVAATAARPLHWLISLLRTSVSANDSANIAVNLWHSVHFIRFILTLMCIAIHWLVDMLAAEFF